MKSDTIHAEECHNELSQLCILEHSHLFAGSSMEGPPKQSLFAISMALNQAD